ncbi:tetratricopeptide repeat-containing sulfotransferase family protein [Thalassotalea agarivorans]|uniref:Tetratricopeptide repeat-containing protein n=1 Tax=Thalassotalea agarivorans TaxID=349064 RepID=A0A1I0DQG6_THASX|nr:tetratricopeptide repeat-containing sulfotransferase family protein [Thalassotalea agarivorans]SET33973.1 Tetratricopeptide repeat-containing protein [Thalassotalea agarivorans]
MNIESNSAEQHAMQQAIQAMKNGDPARAEKIASLQLLSTPSSLPLLQVLGHALSRQKRYSEAQKQVELLIGLAPDYAPAYEDMGSLLAMQGQFAPAVTMFEKALQLQPNLKLCRQKLAQALTALGKVEEASKHFSELTDRDDTIGKVAKGAELWKKGQLDEAMVILREVLAEFPDNVDAMRFMALCHFDKGTNMSDAEALLRRALQIAPDFKQGLHTLGSILHEQSKWQEAANTYKKLLDISTDDHQAWLGYANAKAHEGDTEASIEAYQKALKLRHNAPGVHMAYAHMLKTVGEQAQALEEYRLSIAQKPDLGEAFWSMANLKMFSFEPDEVAHMENQLASDDLSAQARVHFNFSLGKAFEDKKQYEKAWHHYHQGNQQQRQLLDYDPVEFELNLDAIKSVFNEQFVAQHGGHGHDDPAPIFVLGLPRTGSTLVEQIIASHSQVEGTAELPNIGAIAASTGKYRRDQKGYPEALLDANKRDWGAYGREYISQTKHHRVLNKRYFIDKMPNNFMHIGWIKMILPNAKIINTRRYPIDSCLGVYKQLFAQGQNFSYDMLELAEYYKNYVDIMDHWHALFPGEILDVHYEQTVDDLPSQVSRILEFCGLEFEQGCVEFYKNKRQVKTASSEQVRKPIYKSALNLSQQYGDALSLWHQELAPVIDKLPPEVIKIINS